MNHKNIHPFPELEAGLLKLLEENSYRPETLAYFRKKLEDLGLYMADHSIARYSPEVGEAFLEEHVRKNNYGISSQKSLRTVIRRINDYYHGNGFVLMPTKAELPLPGDYDYVLKLFADACMERGNQPSTIKNKLYFCRTFFESLAFLGCESVKEMDSQQISQACVMIRNKDGWAVIRDLMRFLVKTGEIEKDFSILVPSYRRGFRLPSTYSEEEIHRTEKAVDTTTIMGKRDYCIILLASRLGMRAGDIVGLSLENLDFKKGKITFVQQKTREPLSLPMPEQVRTALSDYINSGRPPYGGQTVFLRYKAPFLPLSSRAVNHLTTKYLRLAGVSISGKKHGPHSFRASLATSMVNDSVPYEAVRKILGHSSPDAVRHYAKLDIEKLRDCSINVPPPSGFFEDFLEGRELL